MSKEYIGIYLITSPTNKKYIGQSRWLTSRKSNYKKGNCEKQPKLYASIKSHGWPSHTFEVIHEFDKNTVTQDHLNYAECFYMAHHLSLGFELLNVKEGGYNGPMSEDTKDKLRKKRIGKPLSEAHKQKLKEARKHQVFDDEYRKNKSIAMTGEGNHFYGKTHTPETRKKMSENRRDMKGVPYSFCKEVHQFTIDGVFFKTWVSLAEAARHTGDIWAQNIKKCCQGLIKQTGGFKWEYADAV